MRSYPMSAKRLSTKPLTLCLLAVLALNQSAAADLPLSPRPTEARWIPVIGGSISSLQRTQGEEGMRSLSKHKTIVQNLLVANCDDAGTGSLREVATNASDGETVDLTQLACGTITLATGAITISANNVSIVGNNSHVAGGKTVGSNDRIFKHTGNGTLTITGLYLYDANYIGNQNAHGGCIYSAGSVMLTDSVVTHCIVAPQLSSTLAGGGGIYAQKNVGLLNSSVTSDQVESDVARGGGIYVRGGITAKYSAISGNSVSGPNVLPSKGGGIYSLGIGQDTYLKGVLVSENTADDSGAFFLHGSASSILSIVNSTISGNSGRLRVGGGTAYGGQRAYISNSTFAFNQAGSENPAVGFYSQFLLTITSSIFSTNLSDVGVPNDVHTNVGSIEGDKNLIEASPDSLGFVTTGECPRIGMLADNGGPTLTHALLHDSSAIDVGVSDPALLNDQRGSGFPRVFGSAADIGAFERQAGPDDELFAGRFDSKCY